jgi:hypothetical protein
VRAAVYTVAALRGGPFHLPIRHPDVEEQAVFRNRLAERRDGGTRGDNPLLVGQPRTAEKICSKVLDLFCEQFAWV